jgi:L-histidine Nalpha-methyltransferase / hercynylcysteine S-oxide synthase
MLIQRAGTGTLPPPSFARPSFDLLSRDWDTEYSNFYQSPMEPVVRFGGHTITLGHNDLEADDPAVPFDTKHAFGWDNEHPQREVHVAEFKISWRPVTNGEFFTHWSDSNLNQGKNKVAMPASWVQTDGSFYVRTLYGPIAFNMARHWPVQTNYDDFSTYARVKGGRIPTLSELRAFWEKFQSGFVGGENVGFRHWHPMP